MSAIKEFVKGIPLVGETTRKLYNAFTAPKTEIKPFPGSRSYWQERYAAGGNSGVGSYGKFAEFKAEVINSFVRENRVGSVIEFGCGDGNQLMLADYPRYTGFDVSDNSIARCREVFAGDATKSFQSLDEYSGQTADLTLSLDVVYHLIEDAVFEDYMYRLFVSATRFVIVYSSNTNDNAGFEDSHVRHRKFTDWVKENVGGWSLKQHIRNRYPYNGDYQETSFADFFVYEKLG